MRRARKFSGIVVTRFDLLLMGADMAQAATHAFQSARSTLPVIDAGEAAAELLARIETQFQPKTD